MKFGGFVYLGWGGIILEVVALLTLLLAAVGLALLLARRNWLTLRTVALADGVIAGLVVGMALGILFLAAQSHMVPGFVFAVGPQSLRTGLLLGLGLGAVLVLGAGAIITWRNVTVVGVIVGAALALVLFRMIYGSAAGFGGEVGSSGGADVGVMFALAGGLLGGIVGGLFGIATRNRRALPQHTTIGSSRPAVTGNWAPLIGLLLGGLGAALIGALGAEMGFFQFVVPYDPKVTDVVLDTSPTGMLHGLIFGLSMFAIGGALIGCFLGLQWKTSATAGVRRYGFWFGIGLVTALFSGISYGLSHLYVGGPLILDYVPPDSTGGLIGLLIGLSVGAGAAILLLVVRRANRANSERWLLVQIGTALLIGVVTLTLVSWYLPLFAIGIM